MLSRVYRFFYNDSSSNLQNGPLLAISGFSWPMRIGLIGLGIVALGILIFSDRWLSRSLTHDMQNQAELRLALFSRNIISELQRTAVVPLLLAQDTVLIEGLQSNNYTHISQRLIALQSEIGLVSILLLDLDGRVVGATDRTSLGAQHKSSPFFIDALRSNSTVFSVDTQRGFFDFTYSRSISFEGKGVGVVAVSVDLGRFEKSWAGLQDAVLVSNSAGTILLSTLPQLRGKLLNDVISTKGDNGASSITIGPTDKNLSSALLFALSAGYIKGDEVIQTTSRLPFRGWKIVTLTGYDSIREKVNSVLALELMAFAVILAVTFYLMSRRVLSRSLLLQEESTKLRILNNRLQREIAERKKMQEDLAIAEVSLMQSSRLAALGEMSAAVSHELNQPLAAMKTYLAGARLLLQRRRPQEAMSSFQRIDDLIDRMGVITRQLKSYARKGQDSLEPTDLREAVSSALSLMEPSLKSRIINITRHIPRGPVIVLADRVRLEQVVINLLRNAIDATQTLKSPEITITLTIEKPDYSHDINVRNAILKISDNGHGLGDTKNLFEPFYTTKKAGDGVGLGLSISSNIIHDFGGNISACNQESGGAVFTIYLPLMDVDAI